MTLSAKPEKGFTLIELLVVISIIAILSLIGITVLSGVQKTARDAKRRSDIDAIAKALETNRSSTGYQGALQNSWFANGSVPRDPIYNTDCDTADASANSHTNGGCAQVISGATWGYVVCGATDTAPNRLGDGGCVNFSASSVPYFYVCARLESNNGNYNSMWLEGSAVTNGSTYCIRNQQ